MGRSRAQFPRAEQALAATWPEDGPRELWRRELGGGYSAITVVDGRLYTMYRLKDDEEIVISLTADDGETLWEHRYEASLDGLRVAYGKGPHSTPLVTGGRIFTIGMTARLTALDAASGRRIWWRGLWQALRGNQIARGYAASPVAYRDLVITTVGNAGRAVMAFAQADGRIVWQSQDFRASQSSPIVIDVGGRDQLVIFATDTIAGLDPISGELLWQHPHKSSLSYNISTPVWGSDGLLFMSSAYGSGSRMLRLGSDGDAPTVEELWKQDRLRIHFTNAVRIGDHVYGTTGQTGAKMLAAVDVHSGEIDWRDRAVGRANLLAAGDKAVILDEDGRLLLAELSPEGLEILAETQLFESQSWTVPTLVGQILYARDEETLVAVELPAARVGSPP
ncbi:MAG: PQQ-binding-like beta-propeller repeat protein [Thermoanaerobaculia bacterium]